VQPVSDGQLVRLLQQGDAIAFGVLYEKYKKSIYWYCFRLLRDEQAAEDATHDTFLRIRSGIHSLINPESLRPWFFRIARNEVMQMLRKTRRNGRIENDNVWDDETPFEKYEQVETQELVRQSLEQLKTEYREVLILREFEQLSYTEIAEVTGATESSVKSRIFKARKALLKRLTPYFREGSK
jgi:RNA polymerase sigma-70 factor (ECF subfamily)